MNKQFELQQCREKKRHFTFLELLFAISIIFAIASFLLPTIIRAKDKAYTGYCLNNLRQIGIAAYTYIDEYDQYVMPGKFEYTHPDNNYNHWINYMHAELITDKSVFKCPAISENDSFDPAGGDQSIKEASYIKNLIQPGQWNGAAISSNPEQSWGWGTTTKYIRVQEVIEPERKIDTVDVATGGIHFNHAGILKFNETDFGIIKDPPTAGFRRVGYHHQLGFNALMGDGHVEFRKRTQPDEWVITIK